MERETGGRRLRILIEEPRLRFTLIQCNISTEYIYTTTTTTITVSEYVGAALVFGSDLRTRSALFIENVRQVLNETAGV